MDYEEREFWLKVRRGLLSINDAIEMRLSVGKYEPVERSLYRQEKMRAGDGATTNNRQR